MRQLRQETVFIYERKRTVAALLTACENAASANCKQHKELLLVGEPTKPLLQNSHLPAGFPFLNVRFCDFEAVISCLYL